MKWLWLLLLILLAVAAIAALFFVTYGRERTWVLLAGDADLGAYDFSGAKRRSSPNDALLCTPPLCGGKADEALPAFDGAPAELMVRIDAAAKAGGEPIRRVDDGSDPSRARYVVHTPLMRFPDTIDVEAVRLEDGKTGLRAYGRAQVGYSDRGNNAARLKRWIGAM